MAKITVRQLVEAEKSGRKLTKGEADAVKQLQAAVNAYPAPKIAHWLSSGQNSAFESLYSIFKKTGFINWLFAKYSDNSLTDIIDFPDIQIERDLIQYAAEKMMQYSKVISDDKSSKLSTSINHTHTHMQRAIAQYFKEKSGQKALTRPQILKLGKNYELANNRVQKHLSSRKLFKQKDVESAMGLLNDSPLALIEAKKYLDYLKKL